MEYLYLLLWLTPFALAYMIFLLAAFTPLGMLLTYIGFIALCFGTGHWPIGAFWVALPAFAMWGK